MKHVLRGGEHRSRFGISAAVICHLPLDDRLCKSTSRQLFRTRLAEPTEVDRLAAYYGDRSRVADRLERGDLCFLAERGEEIGAAVWISCGPSEYPEDAEQLGVKFRYAEGCAWSYDGRGSKLGAWAAMMQELPKILLDRGVRDIFSQIGCDNWRSRDAHRSLGYETEGWLVSARLFGAGIVRCKVTGQGWRRCPTRVHDLEIVRATRKPTLT